MPRARRPRDGGAPAATARRRRDDHRSARAHDLAHDRRLRGDGAGRRRRGDRAGLLARPAAHQRRHLSRLSLAHHRLRALPRRPVRHPPLLHHRAQPEGGEQRGAGRSRDGDPAALRRQGGRRRDGRARLRRADGARGPVPARPDRARQGIRAADHGPHPASRQEARHAAHHGRARRARLRPGALRHRPQQRGDDRGRCWRAATGWRSRSTPRPRWATSA